MSRPVLSALPPSLSTGDQRPRQVRGVSATHQGSPSLTGLRGLPFRPLCRQLTGSLLGVRSTGPSSSPLSQLALRSAESKGWPMGGLWSRVSIAFVVALKVQCEMGVLQGAAHLLASHQPVGRHGLSSTLHPEAPFCKRVAPPPHTGHPSDPRGRNSSTGQWSS